ncbi:toll/interleukin-1 receptor domain-containing protein [Pseudosporangium ferrugineum]|uniref:TIR domain-containing protein n=1 Tax=Pseudosporangium ferrugineum TaxID=439699 RepID=A0A2T0S3P0_9ACTN|nr:toll/interleukin-1 receptor domain-containing protein [Pseudosporangium ferrugineum]PRY28030.1 TIR domain-containing protein [Pseudosporangium ferrugineum]
MDVFISWSGEPSRTVAKALNSWLSMVVQHVDPWMSDEEIRSGARWNETIAQSLDKCDFGIVCVTRSNQEAAWLMFEAGALAKRLEVSRLIPLCIDLMPSDITSPLQAFQGRHLDEVGMRDIVIDLNDLAPQPKRRDAIERLFDRMWPDLEGVVEEARRAPVQPGKESHRSVQDMLGELVTRVRGLEREPDAAGLRGLRISRNDVVNMMNVAESLRQSAQRLSWLESAINNLDLSAKVMGVEDDPFLLAAFPVGSLIRHPHFGVGRIMEIERGEQGAIATVIFSKSKRRLRAPLRQIAAQHQAEDSSAKDGADDDIPF